jgi:hypothetical protein
MGDAFAWMSACGSKRTRERPHRDGLNTLGVAKQIVRVEARLDGFES